MDERNGSSFAVTLQRPGVNKAVLTLGALIALLSVIGLFGTLWLACVSTLVLGIGLVALARANRPASP